MFFKDTADAGSLIDCACAVGLFSERGGIRQRSWGQSLSERKGTAASLHAVTAQLDALHATLALNLPAASLHGKSPQVIRPMTLFSEHLASRWDFHHGARKGEALLCQLRLSEWQQRARVRQRGLRLGSSGRWNHRRDSRQVAEHFRQRTRESSLDRVAQCWIQHCLHTELHRRSGVFKPQRCAHLTLSR